MHTRPLFRKPVVFPSSEVIAAESTRHGGVSPPPYASLNLGKHTADAPENVQENRRRFCEAVGFSPAQLAYSHQIHGVEVCVVEAPGAYIGYDALICCRPGIVLAVSVADCAPVLLYDTRHRIVAAVHAGWRGAAAGIAWSTVQLMAERFGTRGTDCLAYVGTCIDEDSFEVGPEVAAQFDGAFVRFDAAEGQYRVDLKGALVAQLRSASVPPEQIEVSPFSTVLHAEDYFSHRKSGGQTGRMLGVIGLK